ncbi:MAG: site-2 protease family protein [Acidimicrobiales bacterium]
MRQNFRIGSFGGVDVGINWSVVLVFALVTWELAVLVLPGTYGGGAGASYWVAAVIASVAFFASLLAHEISHAVVARHHGVGVKSITLWLFGGVAQLEGEAPDAGADLRIAGAGPLTSVAMSGAFAVVEWALRGFGVHGLPIVVLQWLWEINLVLAAFNLIPAAPLDGGRILRAALWRRWHDQRRAAVAAARAGRGFGIVLIAIGVIEVASNDLLGFWPAMLGLFLFNAARGEERYAAARQDLAHLVVGDVMTPHPPSVAAVTSVAQLVTGMLWNYRGDAVAVTGDHGWLAGVLTAESVRRLAPQRQYDTLVGALMVPIDKVAVGRPEESLEVLLDRMAACAAPVAVVLDPSNRLAGIVTPADLQRAAAFGHLRRHQPAAR